MPNKRAALRQLRKDRVRHARNEAALSELKTLKKRLVGLLGDRKREEAAKFLPLVVKRFDQAAAKHIIHKNVASRLKARLARRLAHTPAASG